MDPVRLKHSHAFYPATLSKHLGSAAPPSIAALGNLDILKQNKMAFFCSVKCPAKLILQSHGLAERLVKAGVTAIGGFHSPVEKECLRILLRGSQPVILCPARSLKKMRIRKEWRGPLDKGRLLFLSPFPDNRHRGDAQMAFHRNRFAAALADCVFIAYAAPSGKTEQFCREILAWDKAVYTFSCPPNEILIGLGVRPITLGAEGELTSRLSKHR